MKNTLRCVATLLAWPTIVLALVLSTGCARVVTHAARTTPRVQAPDLYILDVAGQVMDLATEVANVQRAMQNPRVAATVAAGTPLAVLTARGDASLALTERLGAVCARLAVEDSDLWWECVDGLVEDFCAAYPHDLACEGQ